MDDTELEQLFRQGLKEEFQKAYRLRQANKQAVAKYYGTAISLYKVFSLPYKGPTGFGKVQDLEPYLENQKEPFEKLVSATLGPKLRRYRLNIEEDMLLARAFSAWKQQAGFPTNVADPQPTYIKVHIIWKVNYLLGYIESTVEIEECNQEGFTYIGSGVVEAPLGRRALAVELGLRRHPSFRGYIDIGSE